MGRALHRLSAVAVNKLGPGMHNDGHGLYLAGLGYRHALVDFPLHAGR